MAFKSRYAAAAEELKAELNGQRPLRRHGAGGKPSLPFKQGDYVEVHGLESESGRPLNGQRGVVESYVEEKARFEVRLGPEKTMNLKPENLREPELNPGTQVEICGLDPEAGKLWNGQRGCIIKYLAEDDKLQVHIDTEKVVNLKSGNLQRPPLQPGNQAEVYGLESESGQLMNGRQGIIMKYVVESDRFQVQLLEDGQDTPDRRWELMSMKELRAECGHLNIDLTDCFDKAGIAKRLRTYQEDKAARSSAMGSKMVNLKGENLRRLEMGPGDTVQVFGLESESGKLVNGQEGMITTLRNETGRFEVRFRMLKLCYENLRKVSLSFGPGDCVEIQGLSNVNGGKALNGKRGRVVKYVKETGQFQVCLGPSKLMNVKPENLLKAIDGLNPGDLVEAHGLSSESGCQLNGKTGVIVDYVEGTGRLEVLFEDQTSARLKAENLQLNKPSEHTAKESSYKENKEPEDANLLE